MNSWASSLEEFLAMGKHGDYVWSSYAMTLLTFVGLFFWFRYLLKSHKSQVKSRSMNPASGATESSARKLKVEKSS